MKTKQCPSRDLLRQFDLGMLAGAQFDEISHHIDECPDCCDTLSGMDDQTDAVMRGLRERVPSQLVQSDPELHELIEKANALRDSGVSADTLPTDAPQNDANMPQLEPAQEPDELGRLGDYRVLQCLGVGGMGVVFKAEDINLKREVALKFMKSTMSTDSAARTRFLREAQAAAAITHNNIVTIHQVGEANDTPFLAMQLLEGESLAARLRREGKLPLDEVLRIGREIATGLAAAHERGLSHRDIKPDNIWLESRDEGQGARDEGHDSSLAPRPSPLAPRTKILDFGLARAADDTTNLTQSGAIVGTPSYLSPEQAEGVACDLRCDLFSLGVVMYEMATGVSPFKRGNVMATLLAVKTEEPKSVAELDSELPQSFSDLIKRLLQKDPADRYQSTCDVVQAIDAIKMSADEQTAILPDTAAAMRPVRSRRKMIFAMAIGVLSIGAFIVALQMGVFRIRTEHGYLIVKTDDPNIQVTVKQGNVTVFDSSTKRKFELQPGRYQIEVRELKGNKRDGIHLFTKNFVIVREGKNVLDVRLVLDKFRPPLVGGPSSLDALDPAAIPATERFPWQPKELVAVVGEHRGRHWQSPFQKIDGVAVSPDGRTVVSVSSDGVRLWDAATLREKAFVKATFPIKCSASSPDFRFLVIGRSTGEIVFYQMTPAGLQEVITVKVAHGKTFTVACSSNGKLLITAGTDKTIKLWDVTGPKPTELAVLKGHTGTITTLAISPDGKTLASGSVDGTCRLWYLTGAEPKKKTVLKDLGEDVFCVAFSADGKKLACGAKPAKCHLWDLSKGEPRKLPLQHKDNLDKQYHPVCLAFSPDSSLLAVGHLAHPVYKRARLRVYSLSDGPVAIDETLFRRGGRTVTALAFSPDSKTLFSGNARGLLRSWDFSDRKRPQETNVPTGPISQARSLTFARDGRTLAIYHHNRKVRMWDLSGRQPKEKAVIEGGWGRDPISPDGRWLVAYGGDTQPPRLLDLTKSPPTGRSLPITAAHALAFSHDGKTLATYTRPENGKDGKVRLWDLTTSLLGFRLAFKVGADGTVSKMAFSPDGQTLAIGGLGANKKATVRLWDVSGAKPTIKREFGLRSSNHLKCLVFSPDGKKLATSMTLQGQDVFVCNLTASKPEVRVLFHGKSIPNSMNYTNNGVLFVSFGHGQIIELKDGKQKRRWQFPGPVYGAALSADSRYLATANSNGTAYILRLAPPPKK